MIRRARANSTQYDNILFVVGSAQQIPWQEDFFDKVLSVESFYYYGDQGRALDELRRVMAPRVNSISSSIYTKTITTRCAGWKSCRCRCR